jgi:hypothetical protein
MIIYYNFCLDSSFLGYFRTIIHGHSPICHFLLSVGYFGTNSIYTLISSMLMSSIVTQFTNRMFHTRNESSN